jgi:hypothetical protein
MIGILDTLTFLTLCLTILVLVGRGVWQLKSIKFTNLFLVLTYVALAYLIVGLLSQYLGIWKSYTLFILKTSFGLVVFNFLAVCSISIISPLTNKKLKTLLRLPLIGFLLGWYLKPIELGLAIFVVEMTQLALFIKFKETQLYAFRQQAKSLVGMFLAFVLYYNYMWPFYIGIVFYLVMKFQIVNGVKLKLIVDEHEKQNAEA